ncbi:extracellular solute-binding protein [Paenibacillus sepulcri]|uniref:Extracellular solute-binding protein n=1 Tax=Paenibacillus sepulcri TaxID=359917 RepID=A0ABS7BY86_9BACL|nr:extracellular solute-binding protein [Paenibacillus sepulcri]
MNRKWVVLFIAVMMVATTACGSNNNADTDKNAGNSQADEASAGPFTAYKEPVTFSVAKVINSKNSGLPAGETFDDNAYYQFMEKKFNIKVENDWLVETPEAYQQKISLAISTRDLPDVFSVNEQQLKQLVETEQIADLTSAYETTASPLVKEVYDSYDDRVLSKATFDGKLMALPSTNIGGEFNLTWIRADWLEKEGLQPPKTLDDLIAVAKAFVENDPDGNGKKDTYGFTGVPVLAGLNTNHGFDPILGALHAYKGQWMKDASGQIGYSSNFPEMKAALDKLHQLYADGLIDKEFIVRKDPNELVAAGQVGIAFAPWWFPYGALKDSVKNDSKAEWVAFTTPLDKAGKFNTYDQNPSTNFIVVNKDYKHPEAVVKVLNEMLAIGKNVDPDAADLYKGIVVDSSALPFSLGVDYEDIVYQGYLKLKELIDSKGESEASGEVQKWYEAWKINEESPKKDLSAWSEATARYVGSAVVEASDINITRSEFFGTTKTMEKKWAILQKMENEAFLKIIVGEAPLDSFDQYVADWKSAGGDDIVKEVQEAAKQ